MNAANRALESYAQSPFVAFGHSIDRKLDGGYDPGCEVHCVDDAVVISPVNDEGPARHRRDRALVRHFMDASTEHAPGNWNERNLRSRLVFQGNGDYSAPADQVM